MFLVPDNEALIETKACKHCGAAFPITDKDLEFYEKVSPVFAGEKYTIPSPTFCPDCRQQRRLSFRNGRKLYKRTCDATGRAIVSIYSPDKTQRVYHQDYWWSDSWNPMDYGRDFDFSRPFFDQFWELLQNVPMPSILNIGSENCEYSQLANSKDCYYSFTGGSNESSHLSDWIVKANDSVDCLRCQDIEHCYDSTYCYEQCSYLYSCFQCYSSNHCYFSTNLVGCESCFMCANLVNKKFHWKNEPLSEEEFKKRLISTMQEKRYSDLKKVATDLVRGGVHKENQNIECENTLWDLNKHCKDISDCFEVTNTTNSKYFYDNGGNCDNCMDCAFGMNGQLGYEMVIVGGYKCGFSFFCWPNNQRLWYSVWVSNSQDIFGCIGLKNAQYCIFNKQYTKEEYEALVPKIIEQMKNTGEWGEFFPSAISPFGYNETMASEDFPLTKEQAITGGFHWSDYETPFPKVEKIIPASQLPDDISRIPDDILNWAIECETSKKPFRIIPQELEFYRKHNLPIPRRHPDQRHSDRMQLRNPRKLFERKCDCCSKNIVTTYVPGRPEKVYCEECYQKEIL